MSTTIHDLRSTMVMPWSTVNQANHLKLDRAKKHEEINMGLTAMLYVLALWSPPVW